jgi:hypothetical protein
VCNFEGGIKRLALPPGCTALLDEANNPASGDGLTTAGIGTVASAGTSGALSIAAATAGLATAPTAAMPNSRARREAWGPRICV